MNNKRLRAEINNPDSNFNEHFTKQKRNKVSELCVEELRKMQTGEQVSVEEEYEMNSIGGDGETKCDTVDVIPRQTNTSVNKVSVNNVTQSSDINKDTTLVTSQKESLISSESVLATKTNKASPRMNGVTKPTPRFFLPSDDETDFATPDLDELNRRIEESRSSNHLSHGIFQEVSIPKIVTVPRRSAGVQFNKSPHVFTVVPVDSGELHTSDSGSCNTCTVIPETERTYTKPILSSTRSQIFPGHLHYSPYSTLRLCQGGRTTLAGSPYQTLTQARQPPTKCFYNPYHTVTGVVPTSYQRSESGLRRVSTSKREYGVGGSFLPSLLINTDSTVSQLSSQISVNGVGSHAPPYPGLHRARTLPCNSLTRQVFPEETDKFITEASENQTSAENTTTLQSINQLTVRSAGALSIDVGSTDGRNVKIHGAVESPEQLPLIPSTMTNGKKDGDRNEEESRQTWENKVQFVLACVGNAVGLGNMWRFPYLCYKSGGGAFLIPYFLMLFVCGIPLLLMEVAVGQYTRRGPIAAMAKICPLLKGAGVGTVVISFLLSTYYNVIIAWIIYYLVQSFYSELPWSSCNTTWAVNCFDDYGPNVTAPEGMKSVTEEFFEEVVLEKTSGINEPGEMRLELLAALIVAWILVYFALWKSVKSSGRVVYVTATLPYLLLGAFIWRALTLPGASLGLRYFFVPRWELLADAEVWINAAAQNFNSIGIAFGSMIAFSSYNKFNNNIVADTWIISLTNSFTSLLAGTIVFSTMGNIAFEQGKEIDDVVAEGPGLVFVVYPQALSKMPYANVWAVLFFSLLLILGVDSQFAIVEVIVTSVNDAFPNWIKKYLRRHEFLVLIVCVVSFLLGLPNIMQGGIYFFTLIDYYTAAISLMYLAFFEVVGIVWVYGADRLSRNVKKMTGRLPSLYFRLCWYLAAPVLILTIWIFSMMKYERPSYNRGEYAYPNWAIGVGWLLASCSILPIPIFAVIAIINAKGITIWKKIKNSIKSPMEDCPCCDNTISKLDETHSSTTKKNKLKLVMYTPAAGSSDREVNSEEFSQIRETEITEVNGKVI